MNLPRLDRLVPCDLVVLARQRYTRRLLSCSAAPGTEALLGAVSGQTLNLRLPRPLRPGRGLLLRLPGNPTLLARVTSTVRQDRNSWMVRCELACSVGERTAPAWQQAVG